MVLHLYKYLPSAIDTVHYEDRIEVKLMISAWRGLDLFLSECSSKGVVGRVSVGFISSNGL